MEPAAEGAETIELRERLFRAAPASEKMPGAEAPGSSGRKRPKGPVEAEPAATGTAKLDAQHARHARDVRGWGCGRRRAKRRPLSSTKPGTSDMDEREIEFLRVRVSYLERLVLELIQETSADAATVERRMALIAEATSDGHAEWHAIMSPAMTAGGEVSAAELGSRFSESMDRRGQAAKRFGELWYRPRVTRPDS